MMRTHTCGELRRSNKGEKVKLSGWVHSRRDLGGVIFVDLRDRYGLTQLVFNPDFFPKAAQLATSLRHEFVITIEGEVKARPDEMVNKDLATGEVEILVSDLEILSRSEVLPFEINNEAMAAATNEPLRLEYRFLDLRRAKLQTMLKTKDEFFTYLREYFHNHDFVEVQTPILANSSPEGARDFLIPSRLYPGKFYALPQAPQQFKQLLMVGGMDRYFQIAPCFRDEDTRLDRHYGEFYQLDMEMSFAGQEDVFAIMEPLMKEVTKKFSNKTIMTLGHDGEFVRLAWREALERYGTDKPDLRYGLEIKNISETCKDSGFPIFDEVLKSGGIVSALVIDEAASFSRKIIDELKVLAERKKIKAFATISVEADGTAKSSLSKFMSDESLSKISANLRAKKNSLIILVAGDWRYACEALGLIRVDVANRLNLIDKTCAAYCWITDFPMYECSEIKPGVIDFGHNPFSMPQGGMEALNNKHPLEILAYQYDLVLNGFEISSGGVRNHESELLYKVFEVAGYEKSEVDRRFGGMIKAFTYGAPPHAGNAPGVDRILMVLNDWESIRDIYAFPKDGQGRDLLMGSPSEVDDSQLKELGIKLKTKNYKINNHMKNNNAKYAFLYMFSLVALLFMSLATGQVIFQAINKFIIDVALPNANDFNSDLLKIAISALIISIPIYYLVMRYLSKSLVKGELDKESAIRRWLIYFILFVSSVVMIIWLIATISSFLNGELTTKFILKAVTAIVISGIIFSYYFYDVKRDEVKAKDKVILIYLIATLILTVGSLIFSFFFVESPTAARARKHDEQVLNQFTELDGAFNTYYTKYNKLPDTLVAGLSETPYLAADKYKDPSTNKAYEYKRINNDTYELCADFQTDNKNIKDQAMYVYSDRWPHTTGYQCLRQKALNFNKGGSVPGETVPIGNLPADRVPAKN